MKFYTDGSRIGKVNDFYIGWSAVCEKGVILEKSQKGGSNINAEIFAIRDLLLYLSNKNVKILGDEKKIDIITDSKTSIQIINGFLRAPYEFDLTESQNYLSADTISKCIDELKKRGIEVNFIHVRGHGKDPFMSKEDIWGNLMADYVAATASEKCKNDNNNNNN